MRHGLMRAFFTAVITALAATAAYADQNLPLAPASTPAVASLASGTVGGCKNCNSGGPVVVQGVGSCAPNTGCSAHGPTVKKSCFSNLLFGTATPISGGCLAATNTSLFGSSKAFFNPSNTCNDGGCGRGGRNPCPTPIYGPATPGSLNNCNGPFSYLNR